MIMTYYLKYILKNEEPLRIADDSIAQKGQTGTLHYITGSAMRGYVLSKLAKEDFGDEKEALFTRVSFMNAYPISGDDWLIPSPKGFYEDKVETDEKKKLENVVKNGADVEGYKRARLGEFCNVKNGCINFYSIRSKGELKIKMYSDDMYRNEYIDCGYRFGGAIASDDKTLLDLISRVLDKEVYIGNARSSGMGRCSIVLSEVDQLHPFKSYSADKSLSEECYMMLLSPTAMRDENGEPVGLDINTLQKTFGIDKLNIRFCATSVKRIQGYNRTWNGPIPSLVMYDKGSVFHLTYSGTITPEKIREVMDRGLGERVCEGFGQVLILKDYDSWSFKEKGCNLVETSIQSLSEKTDKDSLKLIAKKYYRRILEEAMDRYIVMHPLDKGMLRSSKTRGIEPILTMNRFNYSNAVDLLNRYFEHEADKEKGQKIHKELSNTKTIKEHVFSVLEEELDELLSVKTRDFKRVMTIPKEELLSKEEMGELKLLFLLKEIRFDSRKENNG